MVAVTEQMCQFCIITHIKTGKLVVAAVQSFQCSIIAHINTGKLIVGAVQTRQCCEIFHACEVSDFHIANINIWHRCNLILIKESIIVFVKVFVHMGAENLIWKVLLVDGNAFNLVRTLTDVANIH